MPLIKPESPENLSSGASSLKEQLEIHQGKKRLWTNINSMYNGTET